MLEAELFTARQTRVLACISLALGALSLVVFGLTIYGSGANWLCVAAPFSALGAVILGVTCLVAGRGSRGMAWAGIVLGVFGHLVVIVLVGSAIMTVIGDS